MTFRFLRGIYTDYENKSDKLVNRVVTTVSNCFDFDDEAIKLAVVKAGFTSITQVDCGVHEGIILIQKINQLKKKQFQM